MRAKWIAALLALGLLTGLFCMVAAAAEQAEEEQAEQAEQTEEQTTGAFAEYPTLAPPTDATLVQRNPYTPTEDERRLEHGGAAGFHHLPFRGRHQADARSG